MSIEILNKRQLGLLKGRLLEGPVRIGRLFGASRSLLSAQISKELKRKVLLVCQSDALSEVLFSELKAFGVKASMLSESSPFYFWKGAFDAVFSDWEVFVSSVNSLMKLVPSAEEVLEAVLELRKDAEVKEISKRLQELGYEKVEQEPCEGEFTLVGDFLRLILPNSDVLEVDFFDEQIETIRVNGKETESFLLFPNVFFPSFKERLSKLPQDKAERVRLLGSSLDSKELLPEAFKMIEPAELLKGALRVCIEPEACRRSYAQALAKDSRLRAGFDFSFDILLSSFDTDFNASTSFIDKIELERLKSLIPTLNAKKVYVLASSNAFFQKAKEFEKKFENLHVLKSRSSGGFLIAGSVAVVAEDEGEEIAVKKSVLSLKDGDFIVHKDYGIGIFRGIVTREAADRTFDFFVIEYANGEKLFVPLIDIDRLLPYSGKTPKLSKLGSTSWRNLKRKIKASVLKLASELAQLYKERKTGRGIKIRGDLKLLREFEKEFPYKETADQLKAIIDVYSDLESDYPMDRLICGDVGFGKTEVALRAAMKSVSEGYQVALIAPTTVLAAQHYETFKERFKNFPFKVEMLSRFKSRSQQEEIIKQIKEGKIDIIIGTHRLTSDDVKFKNLGLLIVDEEHKFGVKTKEKILSMKRDVNVLYLSATPIPRTLYSALSGLRDISVIRTPPPERKGTKVIVKRFSSEAFKRAVAKELERGGQVFVVKNEISGLKEIEKLLKESFDVKVDIVHGKMKADKIEKIMYDFYAGKTKILIATSIVESGLDVPRANTLIVLGAENFGISQLYQLKGRVGRRNQRGYCYLFTEAKELTPQAEKRLEALKKVSPLGGGFELALRDLEIRGAGNLLGHQQSGFIDAVGIDMFSELLKEALESSQEVDIELELEAFIPSDFESDPKERARLYAELASADEADLESLKKLRGFLPDPVINTFKLFKLKKLAKECGLSSIKERNGVMLKFKDTSKINAEKLIDLAHKDERVKLLPDSTVLLDGDIDFLIEFLETVKED